MTIQSSRMTAILEEGYESLLKQYAPTNFTKTQHK